MSVKLRLLACVLCPVLLSAANTKLAENPEVASGLRLLEMWIEAQMAYREQPGLSIGIVYDQDLVWAKGYGYADVAKSLPATPQTIYRMASNTKMFTAVAIMQLRDAGKLQLDDPITRHLPWFKIQGVAADTPPITIRHLLTHTAGLPREAAAPYWTDFRFPTTDEIRRTVPTQNVAFPAETRFKYSNLGLALAGEIVEAASGVPYARYIQQNILDPLGMTSSSIELPESQKTRVATGYGRRMPGQKREVMPFTDCKGINPAANLSSTVEDFARFCSLQFRDGKAGGNQVLRSSTLREMHRVHWMEPDWRSGRGLGFGVWRSGDRTFIGHGGSLAGYRTQTSIVPSEKIAVIVMTNSDDGEPTSYVDQVFRLVAPAIKKAVTPEKKPAVPDPSWTRFTGRYRSSWGDVEVLIVNGELVMVSPTANDLQEAMSRLVPAGDAIFRVESRSGGGPVGELVSFESGPDGKVARVKAGENYFRRLPENKW